MKMPNFASRYHSGAWYFANDCQSGWNGPSVDSRSTVAKRASRCLLYFALAFCQASSICAALCFAVLTSSGGVCPERDKEKTEPITMLSTALGTPSFRRREGPDNLFRKVSNVCISLLI